jgi:hypothetical protein
MRIYKNIKFSEDINLSFAEFKTEYVAYLKGFSEVEKKEAYEKATYGNDSGVSTKSKKRKTKSGKA